MNAERWKLVLDDLERESAALKLEADRAADALQDAADVHKEATRKWNKAEAAACAIHELLAALTPNNEGGAA